MLGRVMFAAVDCTSPENDDLCSQNDINAYPTIKYFKFGKFISEYDGPRNADGFQSFLQKFGQTASPKAPPAEFMFDETTVVCLLDEQICKVMLSDKNLFHQSLLERYCLFHN